MPWEYHYENHDWDMTLASAKELFDAGGRAPVTDKENRSLSYYTASMLLSFCAVESFTNSLAFLLHKGGTKNFNYVRYGRISGVWGRIELVAQALDQEIDKSRQPFAMLEVMRDWRNELAHSKPFSVEPKVVNDPSDVSELAREGPQSSYKLVSQRHARAFCRCAHAVIARFQRASKCMPITYVSYRDLDTNQTIKIERRSVKLGEPAT
jgi:hypothetical protein